MLFSAFDQSLNIYLISPYHKAKKNLQDLLPLKGCIKIDNIRPRSKVLNISLNNTEHLLSAKCSERLTTLLSFVHPC